MRGRDTFIRLRACASDTTDGNRVVTSAISRFFVPKRESKDTVCEKSRWCNTSFMHNHINLFTVLALLHSSHRSSSFRLYTPTSKYVS